jgi:hypothetical protein
MLGCAGPSLQACIARIHPESPVRPAALKLLTDGDPPITRRPGLKRLPDLLSEFPASHRTCLTRFLTDSFPLITCKPVCGRFQFFTGDSSIKPPLQVSYALIPAYHPKAQPNFVRLPASFQEAPVTLKPALRDSLQTHSRLSPASQFVGASNFFSGDSRIKPPLRVSYTLIPAYHPR